MSLGSTSLTMAEALGTMDRLGLRCVEREARVLQGDVVHLAQAVDTTRNAWALSLPSSRRLPVLSAVLSCGVCDEQLRTRLWCTLVAAIRQFLAQRSAPRHL
jgi:hypothetical protein